ncbi:hypothetical protein F5888DRAFT_1857202, partial [Russula emetica]
MSILPADDLVLRLVVEHVFMPPKLPQKDPGEQIEREMNVVLCDNLIGAARDFLQDIPSLQRPLWNHMIKMMDLARRAAKVPFEEAGLWRVLSDMAIGDVFSMHIRAQNAALIVRRLSSDDFVQFEVFEVSPQNAAIMTTKGKLLCSYPGPAIHVPVDIFKDERFLRELSSFLVQMDVDPLDSTPTTSKGGSDVVEVRETVHPRYISELLMGILGGCGQLADVDRITKRIGDEVLWDDAYKPWRRSPLWLTLKVSLQSSLRVSNLYKPFMLFFHTRLLRCCVHGDFPSELLYTMRAKMARRLSKIGPSVSSHVYDLVHESFEETEALLSKRWTAFQAKGSTIPTWQPDGLNFSADAEVSLHNSNDYLATTLRTGSHGSSQAGFTPPDGARLNDVRDFTRFTNGRLAEAVDKDQCVALKDFEFTVEKNLGVARLATTGGNDDAPNVIASCIQQYVDRARGLYGDNAEDNSIMILTIMDLWVVLDTFTIQQCPLLKQYSPEIPSDFLHPLLLHRSSTLKRALRIEEYLSRRHNEARNITSIFSNNITESSFAVKYFRGSEYLKDLYDEIIKDAKLKRDSKRKELDDLNESSKSRSSEASKLDHEYDTHGYHVRWICEKCQLENKARALKIHVHEWPLPSSMVHAQQTVFELSPPPAFSAWRDITYMVLRDLGPSSVPDSHDSPKAFLNTFSGLSRWATQNQRDSRLTIGSTTKSFSDQTHYQRVGIPAEESSVLVNIGLSFSLFDRTRGSWTIGSFFASSVTELCTPPIPTSSPYRHLHHFVSDTKHTPNDIIASQADCPAEITLHEFLAFSGLRSGPRLQWLNIARELASPYLSFRLDEVHTLVTQAAWQLGPLSDGVREWHIDLGISSFGNALLRELESLLEKIESNWLEEVTVRTIALISSRLLASTTDSDISRQACKLLKDARNVAYQWVCEVIKKLSSTKDEVICEGLRLRLCMIAATCFSTFDVCSEHLPAVLATEEDFSVAMECAVIVHDNKPPSLSDGNSPYLARMLSQHRRLLHHLEPTLCQSMPGVLGKAGLLHADAYDKALKRLGYRRNISSRWHALPEPNVRWISCGAEGGHEVHYDLLTGKLLVDGKPLGRLPQEIVEDPTYASVLGTKILDVRPADIPGMDYKYRDPVSGYEILFSWNNGDLILRARSVQSPGNSQILQLIPRPTLFGDFPRHFVDEYVHWLDLETRELEFRPAGSPWKPAPSEWRFYVHKPGSHAHPRAVLQKPSQDSSSIQLIDIRSKTFDMVSSLLSPLESPEYLTITHASHSLDVSLPRLHLSFIVNSNWELECRSIPGYIVDKTQSFGTMFGLKNKLVLCPKPNSPEESLLPRRVVIPEGEISFRTDGDFTGVSIDTSAEQHVRWHEYTVDTDLGCLKSNASLRSKLYLCYLHALTSHCLPDPLLGHTGTEEALYMLRSAGCRSFQRLDNHEAELLKSISNLTPDRVFYPPHLRSMAKVEWKDLPTLSQHHDFYRLVHSILDHAHALEAFYDQPVVFDIPNRDQSLLNRAASRNKSYYPSDLQVPESSSSLDDIEYRSRDVSDSEAVEHVAYRTSWSIWNDKPSLDRRLPGLWDLMSSWRSLGPASGEVSLRYSRYWLDFDAEQDWFVIYNLCRHAVKGSMKIGLSFCLSAAAYSNSKYADIIPFFVALALDEGCCELCPPPEPPYTLSDGVTPEPTRLVNLVSGSSLPITSIPAHFLTVEVTNSTNVESRRKAKYYTAIRTESSLVKDSILRQWPYCRFVDFRENWFNKDECRRSIEEYVRSISRNQQLRNHVQQLESILKRYRNVSIPLTLPYVFSPQFITNDSRAPSYSICEVLSSRTDVPTLSTDGNPFPTVPGSDNLEILIEDSDDLETLIEEFRNSKSPQPLLRLYGDELSKSHHEQLGQHASQSTRAVPPQELLRHYNDECCQRKDKLFSEISATLASSQNMEKANGIAGLWPRVTPRSLLHQLAQDHIATLPDRWKAVITRYAVFLLKYQQSRRLLELSSRQKHEELFREIDSMRRNVLAESTPDWLLVQIEANLVARPVQVAVAREMISPSSKRNISLQLNMGEGKSSVIVPLVASTLADGSNLMRVVTLKPLSNQMFQLLVGRLSGLLNRPIFYIPFSRSLRMNVSLVNTIRRLYGRCAAEGGVLVVQPEHILSQKLMHIDFLLKSDGNAEKHTVGHELRVLQDWVTKVSRDVLDESDELLHVRYQLVYTAGEQMPVDDHPNRWTTIQQVFSRLQVHAVKLHAKYPKMIAIDNTTLLNGFKFPIIRILDSVIFRDISSLIIDDALGGGLSNLPLGVLPSAIRGAARRFISQKEASNEDRDLIHSHCAGTTLFKGILLLRGLLMDCDGILGYVLKERRWRVDFGLDPSRTLLAVPYRAKDVPSLRAEFGHPDVAITLTCLSYYYGGLSKDQLLLCFELLTKLDDPKMEYDHWVELGHDLPAAMRQLNGVNTKDNTQVVEILVPLFSRNKRVVDFYLSQVVFARAAREFPSKLPTSAWDLVEDKKNIITGFSGTNDNRYLLPTSITQEDPDFVLGTNALVLQYLLLPENDHYECTEGENGERESATAFLQRLVNQDPEIRVLLDVGAQMLELQNEDLARHWLSLRPDVSAAIFFNDSDDLTVVTQDGTIEPFISSPFNRQLEKCVVYLDDTHTRGTDLKFPRGMRAAVTLGPKVTKDRLVQGCMRMRQLGKGHSVMFFAPGEVDRRIRSHRPLASEMTSDDPIRVLDVLRWAMHETCEDIRHHLPHWAQQGVDHNRRFAAYKEYKSTEELEVMKKAWLQRESRTLEEMYSVTPGDITSPEMYSIPSIRESIERLGVTKLVDVRMTEEQEREADHEVEQERQVERPLKAQPAFHIIHKDIREFVRTGNPPSHISRLLAPLDMAEALNSTTEPEWSPSPLATADFIATIRSSDSKSLTDYLRPVNWILSSGSGKDRTIVVISPYEANELLPIIRQLKKVRLHVYAPRVTFSMCSFSDLTFHTIPDPPAEPWSAPVQTRIQLNLFSGQLYFDSREEYERVCGLLALSMAHPGAEHCEIDGFVPPGYRKGRSSPLAKSKIGILKVLISLRRKGMGYNRTHLGQILNASPLSEK